MREALAVHIGQAGCQIGSDFWKLICLEHGIGLDGQINESKDPDQAVSSHLFFKNLTNGSYTPRAIFCDLEPSVVDEIKAGKHGGLFNPSLMVNDLEDAASNYARGYYSVGRNFLEIAMNQIRREIESCEYLQALFPFHSFGGGTGSGFTSLLLQNLSHEYSKVPILPVSIYPSARTSTGVVEPYNSVLLTNSTIDCSECSFVFSNSALDMICSKALHIDRPSYENINKLISQAVSSLTAPTRFGGSLNVDIKELSTNLVPYPRLHFPTVSYNPIHSKCDVHYSNQTVKEITEDSLSFRNSFISFDRTNVSNFSWCLLYRGDVTPRDVNEAISFVKNRLKINFVNWCPTGFKIGICKSKPVADPESGMVPCDKALCGLVNSSLVGNLWKKLNYKFDIMYKKNAFLHWYFGEGMENAEFMEARESTRELEYEYNSMND